MDYDVVIFHSGCTDGWCAAWVAVRAGCRGAELVPASYGQPPPDVAGKRVLIADFSYKRSVMRQILSRAHQVTVLDHHKTAEAELAGLVDEFIQRPDLIQNPPGSELPLIHFDQSKSGARLAWEHFHPGKMAPMLVCLVEDRDLWRWSMAASREINAAVRSYPMDVQTWDTLHGLCQTDPGRLVREGQAILRYQQQVVADHVRHAREESVAGYLVPCVNATVLFSEIAGELAKGKLFAAAWFVRDDGKQQYSLRSDENGLDVSEVARWMGGGGHPRAAGFEMEV